MTMKKSWMCVAMSVVVMALVLSAGTAGADVYWQFDENFRDGDGYVAADDVLSNNPLTNIDNNPFQSGSIAANPIPNPDPGLTNGKFKDGSNPKDNPNSVGNPLFESDTSNFQMRGDASWTMEGFFQHNAGEDKLTETATLCATRNYGVNDDDYGWWLAMTTDRKLFLYMNSQANGASPYLYTDSSFADAAWHHFALVYDHDWDDAGTAGYVDGQVTIYVDGNLEMQASGMGKLVSSTGERCFTVGVRSHNNNNYEDNRWGSGNNMARLDEWRWSERVLAPDQLLNYVETTSTDAPIAEPASLGLLGLALLGLRKRRS
jgi:hypothetical protein